MRRYWTAAVTKFAQEQRAAHHVERQGFRFWLPQVVENTDGGIARRSLLFPGYIFVQIRSGWHALLNTRGISRLFLHDEVPVRMRDAEVASLMGMEDDGVVVLPPMFADGAAVLVGRDGGAFVGRTGLYAGQTAAGRCEVLIELMGRSVRADLRESCLLAA